MRVDVCVIGAGLAGCSVAYHAAIGGRSVVVLDEGNLGSGATGHTAGHVLQGYFELPHRMSARLGVARTQVLQGELVQAREYFRAFLIDAGFESAIRPGYVLFATDERQASDLRATFRYWKSAGHPVEYLEGPAAADLVHSSAAKAALLDAGSFCVDRSAIAGVLHALVDRQGIQIVAGVRANSTTPLGDQEEVATSHGPVVANDVVICAGVGSNMLHPALAGALEPSWATYVILDAPDTASSTMVAASDCSEMPVYFNKLGDGRLLFGVSHKSKFGDEAEARTALNERLARIWPDRRVDARDRICSAPVDYAPDGPLVRQLSAHVWASFGYSGLGLALSFYAGATIRDGLSTRTRSALE